MSATVELTPEQEQKLLATGKLFHALSADPRYRHKVLGLIKEAAPDTIIPELDMEGVLTKKVEERFKPKEEAFQKLNERFDSLEKTLARERFKGEAGLSDEELVEVEEIAKKEQIGSSKAAVELWKSRQALGKPRSTRTTPPGAAEYLGKLAKVNPNNQKALRALAEEEATRIFSQQRKAS